MDLSDSPGRPACPSRASGWSSLTTPCGLPGCARFPRAHAVATTPAQRLGYAFHLRIERMPMRRREFIAGLGGVVAWPAVARAQQTDRMRRIGVLLAYPEADAVGQSQMAALRQGLQEFGWNEGRNLRIDYR